MENFSENDLLTTDFFTAPAAVGEKYLSFFFGETAYAVASGAVAEVSPPLPVTPLPRVSKKLAGLVNLRGKIVPVINLAKLWNSAAPAAATGGKLILIGGKTATFAFAIERLGEIRVIQSEAIEPANETTHLRGKIVFPDETLNLLDVEWIIAEIEVRSQKLEVRNQNWNFNI